jgi:hypothetical protein
LLELHLSDIKRKGNIKTAFMKGKVREEMYVQQPPGAGGMLLWYRYCIKESTV